MAGRRIVRKNQRDSLSLSLPGEIQGRFAKLPSAINRARLMPEQRQTRVHEFTSEIR